MHGFIDSPRAFSLGLASDSSGRYPCKYPGCDKTFAQVCSAMRHERRCHQFWRSKTRNSGLSMMSDDFSSAMDTSKLGECYDDQGVNIATSAASALHEDGEYLWSRGIRNGNGDVVASSLGSCGYSEQQEQVPESSELPTGRDVDAAESYQNQSST